MICPDCGQEFDLFLDSSEFNSLNGDLMFSYSDLPYQMCYQCARRYHESLFGGDPDEESDESYDYLF